MDGAVQIIWLVLFVVAFWFLLIRPQKRRQMELIRTQQAVGMGDQVMLNSGIFATVTGEVDDYAGDCLMVEVSPGVQLKIARGAVARVVPEAPEGWSADADADTTADAAADSDARDTGATAVDPNDPGAER